MPLMPVTNPELLAQLNEQPARRPVTDPEILRQLNGEAPQKRGLGQEVGRQLGLTARYGVEGGLGLAGTLANAPAWLMNKGLAAVGADYRFPDQNQLISQTLTDAGLPQPEGKLEEAVGSMSRGVAGAGSGLGLARTMAGAPSQAVSQAGQTMAQQPLVQGVAGVTGPAASEVAEAAGAGPIGQGLAGLAGSMAPSVAASGAPGLTRAAFRGGEQGRQQMAQTIQDFADAGTTPSVGQATQRRAFRAAETGLANAPGSGGVMARKAGQQGDEMAAAIEQRASTLARKTSGEQAGRAIERAVRGEKGFLANFKTQEGKLYDRLDEFIPKDRRVDVSATKAALRELNADIEGAPAVSEFFKNSKIKGIESALKADTEGLSSIKANPEYAEAFKSAKLSPDDVGLLEDFLVDQKLPYEALKKLRTLVGREISDSTLASDVPRSKWKALYGALSKDLEGAAKEAGPKAMQAWSRANTFTRAGHSRIESIESVIDKAGGPETIFRAATANTKEGATTLRAVMQSLDKEGQKTVSATVLRRLGIANPSNQDDLGEQFSTSTFLTNWNKLSPEAKRTLFDRYGPKFREDMNQIAKVAANLREGSEVFRNPSGTARQQALWSTTGGFALSVLTGRLDVAAGIAAGVGGANLSAKLMTNPRFVRWLAQATKHPTAHTPSMINQLAQEARKAGDEDLAEAAALLNDAQNQQQ